MSKHNSRSWGVFAFVMLIVSMGYYRTDLEAPLLEHTPITSIGRQGGLIKANASDDKGLDDVVLFIKTSPRDEFGGYDMIKAPDGSYGLIIGRSFTTTGELTYFIRARDKASNEAATEEYTIPVLNE